MPLGPRAALHGPRGHDALREENPFCLGIRYENTPFPSIARELQSLAERDKSGQLARFRQLYGQFRVFLHRNHYLLMLLKRHIVVLGSHDIAKCDAGQVAEIKKMCEEVSQLGENCYDCIL